MSYFDTFIGSPKQFLNKKLRDNFPQVENTKLSRVLEIVYQECVKGDGRHSEHFSLLKKCSHLRCLRCL